MIKTRLSRLLTHGVYNLARISRLALLILLALLAWGLVPAAEDGFDIKLWPNGRVRYKFDVAVTAIHQTNVEREMDRWETELTIPDPSGGPARTYITFEESSSTDNCPDDVLVIRYNNVGETNNFCTVGRRTSGACAQLNMNVGVFGSCSTCPNTIRHELGHCLGLWHEFNRADADRWLRESPDEDGEDFEREFNNTTERSALMPMIGNYDYDSLMHYSQLPGDGLPTFTDRTDFPGNRFGRVNLDNPPNNPTYVSERDKSRLLQYYAWEQNQNWGFFKSLSSARTNPDSLPNALLATGVHAIGSPAIAFRSPGNYEIFTRGSDNCLYWRTYQTVDGVSFPLAGWQSIGCHFSSDPSAVSRSLGRIDVAAVNDRGDVQRIKYIDGNWYDPLTLRGGYPTGGIKPDADGNYIGPAIASRGADSLDVFVVRADDGRLAVTTWSGGNWGQWRTLGAGYDVTARPAAVALSATQVQLAINENDVNLYEPLLTFPPLVPSFSIGILKGTTAARTPPALTTRDSDTDAYRVLITNADGRISHRFARGSWRDIGGIPRPGTGPSAVATGRFSASIVMNGEEAKGCAAACAPGAPNPDQVIQPGGLWLRHFE